MFYVSCVCTRMSWLAKHDNLARVHVQTYLGLALRAKDQYQICSISVSIAIQGGSSWNRAAKFNHIMFNVNSMEASAARIAETIVRQPAKHAVVVMAHNGPAGLGQQTHDICGQDWLEKAGEH